MVQIIYTEYAINGLVHIYQYLVLHNPSAMQKASRVIAGAITDLKTSPRMGKIVLTNPEFRELTIAFGHSGYKALYAYEQHTNLIAILALRHQSQLFYPDDSMAENG